MTTTESVEEPSGEVELIRRYVIHVVEGPDKGLVHTTEGKRTIIGSHRGVDLQLTDRSLSRFHCELLSDGKRLKVRDLDSRNGTRLDGTHVLNAFVRHGALLKVGRTTLRVEFDNTFSEVRLSESEEFGTAVGRSIPMRRAFAQLERAALSDSVVVLQGETGTGKDIVAESIHAESSRCNGPFVVVDCGAMPGNLLESELFGHERGAFTGADSARRGAAETADGGTLFLDEIGELPLDLQPKLLRLLERREVQRVGSATPISVDVRIIAATNVNLRRAVNSRKFRADLYYRLAVLEIGLPPLRERKEDIPLLVRSILDCMNALNHPAAEELLSDRSMKQLTAHSWPGNVRELRNYVERCLMLSPGLAIEADAPGTDSPVIDVTMPFSKSRERWSRHFERQYLERLLQHHRGNVSAAARAAQVDRVYMYRLLKRVGLR